VHLLTTREGDVPAARIDTHDLQVAGDDTPLAQRHVLACGPDGFVAAARERLAHQVAGFQAEAFTPPAPLRDASSEGRCADAGAQWPPAERAAWPLAAGKPGSPWHQAQAWLPHGHLQHLQL
jgi:ferredoxin-NADP reductase